MFDTLLIANRGEIACRIIHSARAMGLRCVAVYSDADAEALHVRMADMAVHIGGPAPADSYLQGRRIIAAALETGAGAIHPGYGFLSENPEFALAVEKAGLIFVGPPVAAIRAMGLKDAAKALMETAGVPVVPGYHGGDQDAEVLALAADKIGYPVMIKARAGGGGKGMRLVERPADFAEALAAAAREGQASFGDPAVLVEKCIEHPRHIEIQILADAHGNVVHLFERDCSLQRRHQKVIEEAPAPGMTPDLRAAMGAAAVEAARAVSYVGAGTVEFIVDASRGLREDGFWFMEMNTRLQVEHPVTEAITGLDLVALQLSVAMGEPLPFAQADLAITGHAIEARIYAEDVARGFLPATGTLDHLAFPEAAAFAPGPVRVDCGVAAGDAISPWYDPMIAKLIVHGPDRAAALRRLRRALAGTEVAGTLTNLPFLTALAGHDAFVAGQVDTGLIGREFAGLADVPAPSELVVTLAGLAALDLLRVPRDHDPFERLTGWRHFERTALEVTLGHGDAELTRRIVPLGDMRFGIGGDVLGVRRVGAARFELAMGGHRTVLSLVRHGPRITVMQDGASHVFTCSDPLAVAAVDVVSGDRIVAPMPGMVKLIRATPGATVTAGQTLLVLEAMKMEHTLGAPRDGTVADILVDEGAQTTEGAVLITLVPHDA